MFAIPFLVIIAFWIAWQVLMVGLVIFSIICMLGFGIAVIFAEEAEG